MENNYEEQVDLEKLRQELKSFDEINILDYPIFAPRGYRGKVREIIVNQKPGRETKIIIGMPEEEIKEEFNDEDAKILQTLIELWDEQGNPDHGCVMFTLRQLVQKVGKDLDAEKVKRHLNRLRYFPVRRYDGGITHFINGYRMFERKKNNFVFFEVMMNDVILQMLKTYGKITIIKEKGGQNEEQSKRNSQD